MKVLVGLTTPFMGDDKSYEMCIVDVDQINSEKFELNEWEKLDIEKLAECSNIEVDINSFKSNLQDPNEYLKAEFDLSKIIGWQRGEKDFFVTDIYYDEDNHPQLYRVVNSGGYVSMHDISEFEYRKYDSILGKDIEKLPEYVRKSSLNDAYEWWRKMDEAAKDSKSEFLSSSFEMYEDMPVKLLYHYLTGVRGFKEGFHTTTEYKEDYREEELHEYFLYKGTANIKLTESIPKEQDKYSLHLYGGYNIYGREKDPYPDKRKVRYYGADMSMICSYDNFPKFNLHEGPTQQGPYDDQGINIVLSYQNRLIYSYNKIEEAGCIQNDWRLSRYGSLFGMTSYDIIPMALSSLAEKLQGEKEGVRYGYTHGHWSASHTMSWMEAASLALSTQYYSDDLKKQIEPILDSYLSYYNKSLDALIDSLGSTDAYYAIQWTKENAKQEMDKISSVMPDGTLKKSNTDFGDEIKEIFTFARNDYDLPDWLRIYEPEVIKGLGGVDILKDLVATRGEEESREVILSLAPGIEQALKEERRQQQRNE